MYQTKLVDKTNYIELKNKIQRRYTQNKYTLYVKDMRTNIQTRKMLRHKALTKNNEGINVNEIDRTIYVLMNNRKNTDYAVKII